MRKVLLLFALFILFFVANTNEVKDLNTFVSQVQKGVSQLKEKVDLESAKASFNRFLSRLGINIHSDEDVEEKEQAIQPSSQPISVYNIEIGELKDEVEKRVGKPERISLNEYGVNWHAYHENYRNFLMISYDQSGKVAGIYTNQPLISSSVGVKAGWTKEDTRNLLGTPLEEIRKGRILYKLPENRHYDLFQMDGNFITIFYDKFEKETVRAVQIISANLENKKNNIYPEVNQTLIEGFEYQLFDLVNAERVKYGLHPLIWDKDVRKVARKHSEDMAINGYFSHVNLKGESPFDRLKADAISYIIAGENLAYGQFSSIYAHEGLMNSKGHRENILQKNFEYTGVGVAFNEVQHPYFTQKFYAK
ncbi:CAP domain-containing protein [Fervidibacillus halotolerans]|uniref:CAP domain-containing protein n=1 Tax=Fervidibacillus halotolerans TaxID=2980027 RepID=A0A9E8RZH1_9BACI|nr:CAP domain-containing protein [Fervidibacillus halotolerans]WAA13338.1 CAP domain-containing protein [Fervidibacillus halotolerans]